MLYIFFSVGKTHVQYIWCYFYVNIKSVSYLLIIYRKIQKEQLCFVLFSFLFFTTVATTVVRIQGQWLCVVGGG